MVLDVRRRSSRYLYGRPRGPRRRLAVLVGVVIAVVFGVAAAVMASGGSTGTGGSAGGSTVTAGPLARARHRHRSAHVRQRAVSRRLRHENAEINAALRYTRFVSAGSRRRRLMALTFDDGPSPYTAAIVRVLVRMRVPATFFVVGQQLPVFPAAFRLEVRDGFEIGDHTQNHAWLAHLNQAGQYAQIWSDVVGEERLGAPAPRLFRPPYGIYNGATIAVLRRLRMFMVLWSIDPGDWRRPGIKAIVSNVLTNSRPGRIVIMHDGGGDRSQTIAALPAIIRGLRRRGYRLVSVPTLLRLDPPPRHQQLPRLGAA
jgi:peptidoglycan-N-acetylglucosamine deacetylase